MPWSLSALQILVWLGGLGQGWFLCAGSAQGWHRSPLLASSTLLVLLVTGAADNVWTLLLGASVSSWLGWAWLLPERTESDQDRPLPAARWGVAPYGALADLMLWGAWGFVAVAVGELPLTTLSVQQIEAAGPTAVAACGAGALGLLGGLVCRLGLYPACGWIKCGQSREFGIGLCGFLLPVWLMVGVRLAPVFQAAPAVSDLATKLAGLSALILGLLATFRQLGNQDQGLRRYRICLVAAGTSGLIWSGSLELSDQMPLAVLILAVAGSLGLTMLVLDWRAGSWVSLCLVPAFGFAFPVDVHSLSDSDELLTQAILWSGQLFLWSGLLSATPAGNRPLQYLAMLILPALGLAIWQPVMIPAILACIAGYGMQSKILLRPVDQTELPPVSTLQRMMDHEFYLEDAVDYGLLWPLGCMFLVLQWITDAICSGLRILWRRLNHRLHETWAVLDRPVASELHWEILIGSLVVLLLVACRK